MINTEERFSRQQGLVPQERLEHLTATVIGVGAIGRQVALQLAALGVRRFILIDHDTVDLSNATTQGHSLDDVGQQKVHALASTLQHYDGQIGTVEIPDRFRPDGHVSDVIFCCVDSIDTRAAIGRKVGRGAAFWADGRMRGEVLRILTAVDEASRAQYPMTLFPSGSAGRRLHGPQHALRGQYCRGADAASVRALAARAGGGCRSVAQSVGE